MMTPEEKTQNLFISTNGYKDLYDFKFRGILPDDDPYKVKARPTTEEKKDEQ